MSTMQTIDPDLFTSGLAIVESTPQDELTNSKPLDLFTPVIIVGVVGIFAYLMLRG